MSVFGLIVREGLYNPARAMCPVLWMQPSSMHAPARKVRFMFAGLHPDNYTPLEKKNAVQRHHNMVKVSIPDWEPSDERLFTWFGPDRFPVDLLPLHPEFPFKELQDIRVYNRMEVSIPELLDESAYYVFGRPKDFRLKLA
eukprot:RCo049624